MKLFSLFACSTLLLSSLLQAQTSSGQRHLLVRLERQQDASESRCVIVYDDTTFHAEHMHNSRTDVIEGTVDQGRYTQLSEIVETKQFAGIEHPHLSETMLSHNPDLVSVDVFRENGTQAIRFANRDDRKAYSAQIEPLLKWFDSAQKLSGAKTASSKANRCLPSDAEVTRTILASTMPASPTANSSPAPPANPYNIPNLLLLFTQESYSSSEPIQLMYTPAQEQQKFGGASGTKDCLLVKQDGSAYFGRIKVAPANKRSMELHLSLSADQLDSLKHAMDEPVLANSKELILQAPPGMAKEVNRAEVVAVRSSGTQRLLFRAASGLTNTSSSTGFRGNETIGGRGNDGSKETAPLRNWVKKNLDLKQLETVKQLSGECP